MPPPDFDIGAFTKLVRVIASVSVFIGSVVIIFYLASVLYPRKEDPSPVNYCEEVDRLLGLDSDQKITLDEHEEKISA